jgi:hypothetical protein
MNLEEMSVEELKAALRERNIEYHPANGKETLKELLSKYLQDEGWPFDVPKPRGKLAYTETEYRNKKIIDAKRNANRLLRCRIQCMNPTKKNWTGEIISVGSSKMGTVKKFIPFNSDEPYHIPYILYQELKQRKCTVRTTTKGPNGEDITRSKLINEFSIDVLPPLTEQELHELKQRQAMANGAVL